MQLVDQRVVPWYGGRAIVAPVERGVDDDRAGHIGRTVALAEGEIAAPGADPVAEERVMPLEPAIQRPRIRVDQQLGRVEPLAALGVIRAVHPVAVELPWTQARHIPMPDVAGAQQTDPRILAQRLRRRKQAE